VIDGGSTDGWFTEDFTLAELKTLRTRERIPQLRPANARFDGQFEIPTFEEIMALAQFMNQQRVEIARQAAVRTGQQQPKPQRIGIYPETKHPSYFAALDLGMEAPLLDALERWDYAGPAAPVFIQSFEVGNLQELRRQTHLPLVQLVDAKGQPFDFTLQGDARTYEDLITPAGLRVIAEYADAIGVNKLLIIPRNADETLGKPTALIANAHAQGLQVHGWTFRAEDHFLPRGVPDMKAEVQAYLRAGMDAFFTDHLAAF
jgi:glycerophosphoryl diester phosphodiesterase